MLLAFCLALRHGIFASTLRFGSLRQQRDITGPASLDVTRNCPARRRYAYRAFSTNLPNNPCRLSALERVDKSPARLPFATRRHELMPVADAERWPSIRERHPINPDAANATPHAFWRNWPRGSRLTRCFSFPPNITLTTACVSGGRPRWRRKHWLGPFATPWLDGNARKRILAIGGGGGSIQLVGSTSFACSTSTTAPRTNPSHLAAWPQFAHLPRDVGLRQAVRGADTSNLTRRPGYAKIITPDMIEPLPLTPWRRLSVIRTGMRMC